MNRFHAFILTISSAAVATPVFAQSAEVSAGHLFTSGVANVSGYVRTDRFAVGPRGVVYADEDLIVDSSGPIVIDGTLQAQDGTAFGAGTSAASIALVSDTAIIIRGDVVAGDGADGVFPSQSGGRGTSFYLEAPIVIFELASLRAGDGGVSVASQPAQVTFGTASGSSTASDNGGLSLAA
ncbi:MAG: hypothetical protein DYG94_09830 [Leptolyngbya sp. PLA3]|nr:MAG: hypothetical protein EDM82_07865 [Cyanobacteria bacterium CYA]MCE7969029.1 hypothetical protein [Leptolyngbya sp. PL-A3]